MRFMKIKPLWLFWTGLVLVSTAGILWLIHEEKTCSREITVAVVEDTPAEKRAPLFKKVKNVVLYNDETVLLNALDDDGIDAILIDFLTGLSLIKTGDFLHLKPAGNLIDRESTAVAFHPEDNALRQAINKGLNQIINNGIYAQISCNYFGLDITSKFELSDNQLHERKAADNSWERVRQSGKITVAFFDNNWPFSYFDDDDLLTGFNVDIAKSVCRELGITLNPIVYPQDEIIAGLKNRYYDCIWCSIPDTGFSDKDICLSNPFYISGLHFFTREGSRIKDFE